jgi:hypothetical protein
MRGYVTIENEVAYAAAVKRNILANANKTFRANFERAEEVEVFLKKFIIVDDYDRIAGYKEGFMGSMASALANFGKLSQKQYDTVVRIMDEQAAKREAYIAAVEAQKALSAHVQTIKNLKVKVDKVLIVEATKFSYYDIGFQYVYLMSDQQGNRIVYKTKSELGFKFKQSKTDKFLMDEFAVMTGMILWIKAGIKAHTEYKGEKQTIITRAKVLGVEYKDSSLKEPFDTRK